MYLEPVAIVLSRKAHRPVKMVMSRDDVFRAVPLEHAVGRTPLTVSQLAEKMAHTGGPIIGRASVNPPMAGPTFAANICDIEVDKETGVSRVVRYTAIQDVGKGGASELRRRTDAGRRSAGDRLGVE